MSLNQALTYVPRSRSGFFPPFHKEGEFAAMERNSARISVKKCPKIRDMLPLCARCDRKLPKGMAVECVRQSKGLPVCDQCQNYFPLVNQSSRFYAITVKQVSGCESEISCLRRYKRAARQERNDRRERNGRGRHHRYAECQFDGVQKR